MLPSPANISQPDRPAGGKIMSDLNQLPLDALPDAAVLVSRGQIAAANALARHYLPQLEPGARAPSYLPVSPHPVSEAGTFTAGPSTYAFRGTALPEGRLILFHPAPQSALTDGQLDGAVRQLRQFMGEFLAELGGQLTGEDRAVFQKSYCRMFRLLEHLELAHAMNTPEGLPFHPAAMDLAGLCCQTVRAAAPLLKDAGIELLYESAQSSLLISGDPKLLQRLLLELISNSARAVGQGHVTLRLERRGGRAVLTLSDSGAPPTQRQLAAMSQQDTDNALPLPGQGAGLGLPICRKITALHGGTLLVEWGDGSPTTLVSLPAGLPDPRVTVHTPPPPLQRDGGLSPLLVGLSDVLPAALFGLEELD